MGKKSGFKIGHIDELQIVTRSGTVVGNQTWSQTHVQGQSSGGSQYIGPQGGHVEAPKVSISSTTSERVRLFVREDAGQEFDVDFVNPGVGVREGNRVSILYLGNKSENPVEIVSNDYRIGALVNHSTGKSNVYANRIRGIAAAPVSAVSQILGGTLMLAALPLFIASIYYGFKWEVGFVQWVLFWVAYLGVAMVFAWLFGPKNGALNDQAIEAVRQRVGALPEGP